MSNKQNRLRFVHNDTCFESNVKAKEYLLSTYKDRPSLYAEPMVLRYGDISDPNIILAIGSVGTGENGQENNKVFFIDCAQLDIDNNFHFIDTPSVSWEVNKDVDGIDVKSNVKLQKTKLVGEKSYNNIILNETDGLFTYVNTELINDKIIVNINGNASEYELPDTITGATYDSGKLQITLHTRKNKTITITLTDIIDDIISENDGNLVQNKDGIYVSVDVEYDKETDKLTFNDGVNNTKEFSLLSDTQKTFNENTTQFITQQNQINGAVQSFIDGQNQTNDEFSAAIKSNSVLSAKTKTIENKVTKSSGGTIIESDIILSATEGNILKIEDDGIYAKVNLKYDNVKNELTFSTIKGDEVFELTDHSIVTDGVYDSEKQEIVLTITLDNEDKTTSEIRIPVSDLVNIYDVDNDTDSPIDLTIKKVNE